MESGPSLAELTDNPHPALTRLRAAGPVGRVEALGGWMVVGHAEAIACMRDADTFTVDDPRFTTGQVVGTSMLSLDGAEHARHRMPFVEPFKLGNVRERFVEFVEEQTDRLIDGLRSRGESELRRQLAGPLATVVMQRALGLESVPTADVLGWYDAIVSAVSEVTTGRPVPESGRQAYRDLSGAMAVAIGGPGATSLLAEAIAGARRRTGATGTDAGRNALTEAETMSNAAVLLFGGIETTEGMIANALHLLFTNPDRLAELQADPGLLDAAIEESLRIEPAAAVVDRYATRDVEFGGARIRRGDLVVVSLAGANRDPQVFADPDEYRPRRSDLRRQLAFAQGPHVCLGMHLARVEARAAITAVLNLPGIRHLPKRSSPPTGLVFRKPAAVQVAWQP